jgi:hypothetical protein
MKIFLIAIVLILICCAHFFYVNNLLEENKDSSMGEFDRQKRIEDE